MQAQTRGQTMHLKICEYGDCEKPNASRGWCYGHYRRWLKYGDPSITKSSTKDNIIICSIDGCDSKMRSKGYCQKHYSRYLVYGDALFVPNKYEKLNGYRNSTTHNSFRAMLERCNNPKCTAYKHYGGRGIVVCDRWNNNFNNFLNDMGQRPAGHTLERIDNNKEYSKENCRWATVEDQSINKRNTIRVLYKGKMTSLARLAKQNNINICTARDRYIKSGYSVERSIANTNYSKKFTREDISDMCMFRKAGFMYKDIARAFGTDGRYISILTKEESCI